MRAKAAVSNVLKKGGAEMLGCLEDGVWSVMRGTWQVSRGFCVSEALS